MKPKMSRSILSMLSMLVIFCLFFTGCEQLKLIKPDETKDDSSPQILESGFKPLGPGGEISIFSCAYRSDKTEFDINDVTLDFYYGGYYLNGVENIKETYDFPYFKIYFSIDKDTRFLIKQVDENFISEKYRCEHVRDENLHLSEIKYNYSETLTVPSEIFTEETGPFYFSIWGPNVIESSAEEKAFVGTYIFYKIKEDGKVILSDREFSQ